MSWQQNQDDILFCSECLMGVVCLPAKPYSTLPCLALPSPAQLLAVSISPRPLRDHYFVTRVIGVLIFIPPDGWLVGMICLLASQSIVFLLLQQDLFQVLTIHVTKEMRLNLASSGLGRDGVGIPH